jgi:hypothetical protein
MLLNDNRKLKSAFKLVCRGDLRMLLFAAVMCLFAFTACGTKRLDPADLSFDKDQRSILLQEVVYDETGLPLFIKTLNKRPVDAGDRFTLVLFRGNRPVKTFDILIKRPQGDLMIPVHIVFKRTGEGLVVGAVIGLMLVDSGVSWEIVPALGVVGGAAGFVVGLVSSIPPAIAETEKIMLRGHETVVSYTDYEYSALGQLIGMSLYDPEKKMLLVKAVFHYENGRSIPVSTYITSYPENVVPVIDWSGLREDSFLDQDFVRSDE